MKTGLKLWSVNTEWIPAAAKLAENGVYDFLELYVVPGTISTLDDWRRLDTQVLLHAAHSHGGLNMATPGVVETKRRVFDELIEFGSELDAGKVVFHPGVDGAREVTAANFAALFEAFPGFAEIALLENKPHLGLKGETCVGATPEDVRWLTKEAGIGVCLDFGHALAAGNSFGRPWVEFIEGFLELEPSLFHLSDGDASAEMDSHLNLGDGNYPIAELVKMCPDDAMVTLETAKDPKRSLCDFAEDVKFLMNALVET
jgi:deoxyribonuclease-4